MDGADKEKEKLHIEFNPNYTTKIEHPMASRHSFGWSKHTFLQRGGSLAPLAEPTLVPLARSDLNIPSLVTLAPTKETIALLNKAKKEREEREKKEKEEREERERKEKEERERIERERKEKELKEKGRKRNREKLQEENRDKTTLDNQKGYRTLSRRDTPLPDGQTGVANERKSPGLCADELETVNSEEIMLDFADNDVPDDELTPRAKERRRLIQLQKEYEDTLTEQEKKEKAALELKQAQEEGFLKEASSTQTTARDKTVRSGRSSMLKLKRTSSTLMRKKMGSKSFLLAGSGNGSTTQSTARHREDASNPESRRDDDAMTFHTKTGGGGGSGMVSSRSLFGDGLMSVRGNVGGGKTTRRSRTYGESRQNTSRSIRGDDGEGLTTRSKGFGLGSGSGMVSSGQNLAKTRKESKIIERIVQQTEEEKEIEDLLKSRIEREEINWNLLIGTMKKEKLIEFTPEEQQKILDEKILADEKEKERKIAIDERWKLKELRSSLSRHSSLSLFVPTTPLATQTPTSSTSRLQTQAKSAKKEEEERMMKDRRRLFKQLNQSKEAVGALLRKTCTDQSSQDDSLWNVDEDSVGSDLSEDISVVEDDDISWI